MQALLLLSEGGGPNSSLSWLLWVVLVIFLLIVLIGWWVSRNKGEQAEVQSEAPAEQKSADDLTKLEGIGPKVAKTLGALGITSFADLANVNAAKVQEALDAAGMQYMNPAGWIDQAKLAAAGDMEGLAKLQDELKGGRKTK